jgi:hypothetical protein
MDRDQLVHEVVEASERAASAAAAVVPQADVVRLPRLLREDRFLLLLEEREVFPVRAGAEILAGDDVAVGLGEDLAADLVELVDLLSRVGAEGGIGSRAVGSGLRTSREDEAGARRHEKTAQMAHERAS